MNHILVIPSQTDITKPRAEIERELRLAKEYWLRTVQPYIAGRKLRGVEMFVAQDAYLLLMEAQRKAEDWNRKQKSRLSRLDVDLSGEKFRRPEVLCADENLKPEILAEIAAPLMNKSEAKMTPAEAVRNAHELLMAAERYIGTLPKSLRGIETLKADMELAFSKVTFDEILRSNEKDSGQLPFLPTAQQKRNEGKLSLTALKKAVKVFYEKEKKNRPQLTEEQYNRETEQNAKLLQEGRSYHMNNYVMGKRKTYQEWHQKWQSQPDEEISYCLENNRILLQTLCLMRWERFKKHWQDQQSRTQKRNPSESQRPTTAGKRKQ